VVSVTPAGMVSLRQETLRVSLADVQAFRDFCGVATQAAALARIHHEGLRPPADEDVGYTLTELQAYRPYAAIFTPDGGFARVAVAMSDHYVFQTASGQLRLLLVKDAFESSGGLPTPDAFLQFQNELGLIVEGLESLAGSGGYLAYERAILLDGPFSSNQNDVPTEGVWLAAELQFITSGL